MASPVVVQSFQFDDIGFLLVMGGAATGCRTDPSARRLEECSSGRACRETFHRLTAVTQKQLPHVQQGLAEPTAPGA